ncbi:MAG: molybdopterin-guanine dinucleotide biosynthesis protein B [Pseudomonadota bacterium]|nr:MAG: molybdopterin-guanine dinucleotide biosynthesis protein B [Pseudomonadota bacterium]
MPDSPMVPVLGFAAFSGTGKTTLLTQLLPILHERGYRVGMLKHAHHTFDIDHPGKDSYELRHAGAQQVLVASRERWALMVETPGQGDDPQLEPLLRRFDQDALDLILVEGFKHVRFEKIELHRPALGHPLLYPQDDTVVAIATDAPLEATCPLTQLDLNEPSAIAEFIVTRFLTPG